MVRVEFSGNRVVVSRIDDDRDIVVIFCRCTHQSGPADVDIFDRVRKPDVGCGHGFLEWIEIHDHHVDRLDPMLLHLALMILVSAPGQDSAVNLRMQRLDATVEHLGQAGKILDGSDFHSRLFQSCCRASGRYYFNPVPLERLGKGRETRLVRDA